MAGYFCATFIMQLMFRPHLRNETLVKMILKSDDNHCVIGTRSDKEDAHWQERCLHLKGVTTVKARKHFSTWGLRSQLVAKMLRFESFNKVDRQQLDFIKLAKTWFFSDNFLF